MDSKNQGCKYLHLSDMVICRNSELKIDFSKLIPNDSSKDPSRRYWRHIRVSGTLLSFTAQWTLRCMQSSYDMLSPTVRSGCFGMHPQQIGLMRFKFQLLASRLDAIESRDRYHVASP